MGLIFQFVRAIRVRIQLRSRGQTTHVRQRILHELARSLRHVLRASVARRVRQWGIQLSDGQLRRRAIFVGVLSLGALWSVLDQQNLA